MGKAETDSVEGIVREICVFFHDIVGQSYPLNMSNFCLNFFARVNHYCIRQGNYHNTSILKICSCNSISHITHARVKRGGLYASHILKYTNVFTLYAISDRSCMVGGCLRKHAWKHGHALDHIRCIIVNLGGVCYNTLERSTDMLWTLSCALVLILGGAGGCKNTLKSMDTLWTLSGALYWSMWTQCQKILNSIWSYISNVTLRTLLRVQSYVWKLLQIDNLAFRYKK